MSTPKKFPPYLLSVLEHCLKIVRRMNRFWPTEAIMQLVHSIIPVPAIEVMVVRRRQDGTNEFLLMWRTFSEWPPGYRKAGWYFPGGYMFWDRNVLGCFYQHLMKDLGNEYKRTHTPFDFSSLEFMPPVIIGSKKWMPAEHPFGAPVSLLCVFELITGNIPCTSSIRWTQKVVSTDVPHHERFQQVLREYLSATDAERALILRINERLQD